jgi:hypothetical protein
MEGLARRFSAVRHLLHQVVAVAQNRITRQGVRDSGIALQNETLGAQANSLIVESRIVKDSESNDEMPTQLRVPERRLAKVAALASSAFAITARSAAKRPLGNATVIAYGLPPIGSAIA